MTDQSFKPGQHVLVSKDGQQVPGTVFRRIMANGVWMLRVDTAGGRLTVHPDRVTAQCGTPMKHTDGTVSPCVLDKSHNLQDTDHRDQHGHIAPVLVQQSSIKALQDFYARQADDDA